jgi:hypothetical protein
MNNQSGLSSKEQAFVRRWNAVRSKGKRRYIVTRGIGLGLVLFAVWLAITLLEIRLSEFEQALYQQHPAVMWRKCLIWLGCYLLLGLTLAWSSWKGREDKFHYLS